MGSYSRFSRGNTNPFFYLSSPFHAYAKLLPNHLTPHNCLSFSVFFSLSSSILFFFFRLAQPKISNMVDDNLTMELGEKVNVSCEVTGNPPPSVKWVKRTSEGDYVPVVNRGKENRTLLIKSLRQQHYGDYICVAENKFGHDSVVLSVGKCAMVRGFLCCLR